MFKTEIDIRIRNIRESIRYSNISIRIRIRIRQFFFSFIRIRIRILFFKNNRIYSNSIE